MSDIPGPEDHPVDPATTPSPQYPSEPAGPDVLAPWGPEGPAPVGSWRTDILGSGFESRTLELLPDDEGDVVATLVRYLPHLDRGAPEGAVSFPHFVALFLHGRNDYFFQVELAQQVALAGGAFYALDLRKYGRSLRPWQTIGYVDDLTTYDEDIAEALDCIHSEAGHLPLVLMGHSTGGLTATLWTYRHPGAVAGLVLNSAWLEVQTLASMRSTVQPVLGRIAARSPRWEIPMGSGPDVYGRSLREGWLHSGFDLPARLRGREDDPGVCGWDYATQWKRPESYPVHAQWLDAILLAQETVEKKVDIECPVLSMTSTRSGDPSVWSPDALTSDVVLDVDVIVERSSHLGPLVTIARFDGRHDLFLSDPDVREKIWDVMGRWLDAFV